MGLFFCPHAALLLRKEHAINTTFTNGRVTLTDDLVFGVSVLSEDGYVPLSQLDLDDIKMVQRLLDHNTTCPVKFTDALTFHRTALENAQHAHLNQAPATHG